MLSEKIQIFGTPPVSEPNLKLVPQQPGENPSHLALLPSATFAARFCMQRDVKLEDFEEAMFHRSLYSRARRLRPLLERLPDFFSADRAFIGMVGRATNMREVEAAMTDFSDYRGRYRFLRKRLRLRVSSSIVWMLANRALKEEPPPPPMLLNSRSPFPARDSAWREGGPTVGSSNLAAARPSRAMEEAEISRLRDEVGRLAAQCDLLRRAIGLFSDPKMPPPSLG